MVSEKKIVEIVDPRRWTTTADRRRQTDIKGITKAHPEHSSDELKRATLRALNTLYGSNKSETHVAVDILHEGIQGHPLARSHYWGHLLGDEHRGDAWGQVPAHLHIGACRLHAALQQGDHLK